jgi:hypothetical protein
MENRNKEPAVRSKKHMQQDCPGHSPTSPRPSSGGSSKLHVDGHANDNDKAASSSASSFLSGKHPRGPTPFVPSSCRRQATTANGDHKHGSHDDGAPAGLERLPRGSRRGRRPVLIRRCGTTILYLTWIG